jgi:FkbM family methyltransferase
MEGNRCYKLNTIRRFLEATGLPPIRLILDIGANVGKITLLMARYFPAAVIYAFEPVDRYYQQAVRRCRTASQIRVAFTAVTSQHLYADDFAQEPVPSDLHLWVAKPHSGPGWQGSSRVERLETPSNDRFIAEPLVASVQTLADVVDAVLRQEAREEIDLVKFDCEGCERSCLGCATEDTLRKIRYIVGEYHDIGRFYRVLERKLFRTHNVSLVGNSRLVQKRATSFVLSWMVGAMLSRLPPVRSCNRRDRESMGTAGDSMLSR